MGMDLQTHLGPYLEVTGNLTKPITTVKRQCPNHPKVKQDNNKYCPTCGAEVINVDEIKHVSLRVGDFIDWDDLIPPHDMDNILLPNNNPPKKIKFDTDSDNVIDLSNVHEIMNIQLNWFKHTYTTQIKVLEEKFGAKNVHVRWGIVTYWA